MISLYRGGGGVSVAGTLRTSNMESRCFTGSLEKDEDQVVIGQEEPVKLPFALNNLIFFMKAVSLAFLGAGEEEGKGQFVREDRVAVSVRGLEKLWM